MIPVDPVPWRHLLFDFGTAAAAAEWAPIDDRVMGGISRSRLRHDPAGHAVFEGVVSTDQGGGFASVRSRPAALGWADADACVIEVLGDGRTYKLGLRTDDRFDGLVYQADVAPAAGAWQTLQLPRAAFRARLRGRPVADAPPLDLARIRQVGLVIADRQAGPFALGIRRIALA